MTDTGKQEDDGRIRIWVNSGANMSRGKYAAAAVHAALTAAGVHPGVPVIVLGGHRDDIEQMSTVIHDSGRTEVEPGTATAGTDYVFEQACTPTDDRRIVNLRRVLETDYNGTTGRQWIADGLGGPLAKDILAIIEAPRRRTAVQEPLPEYVEVGHPSGERQPVDPQEERIPGEPFTLEDLAHEHDNLAAHPNQMSQTVPAFHSLTAKALRWADGFRRTAVQEPSAEPTVRDHVRDLTGATDAELDELGGFQGEPSDAQLAEIEQRVYDEHRPRIAGMAKALVRAGWDAALRAAYEEGKKR